MDNSHDDFSAQHRLHADNLIHFLRRRCADHDLAEDVAAAAWLKAWTYRNSFDGQCQFRTWLFKIAINELYERWRKKRRFGLRVELNRNIVDQRRHDPDAAIDAARVMELMRPSVRVIVNMRFFEGLTEQELAKSIGVPLGTIKTQFARSKFRIKQIVATQR